MLKFCAGSLAQKKSDCYREIAHHKDLSNHNLVHTVVCCMSIKSYFVITWGVAECLNSTPNHVNENYEDRLVLLQMFISHVVDLQNSETAI